MAQNCRNYITLTMVVDTSQDLSLDIGNKPFSNPAPCPKSTAQDCRNYLGISIKQAPIPSNGTPGMARTISYHACINNTLPSTEVLKNAVGVVTKRVLSWRSVCLFFPHTALGVGQPWGW